MTKIEHLPGTRRQKENVFDRMKGDGIMLLILAAGAGAMLLSEHVRAQPAVLGTVKNFSISGYYQEAPYQQQMEWEFMSAEAIRQADGTFLIREMRIEAFEKNGNRQAVVSAPESVYDPVAHAAHSPGPLEVQSGDGRFILKGEGFLWREKDLVLTISNKVHTIVGDVPEMGSKP